KIVYKLVGPITSDNLDNVVRAEIDKAMKAGS
ncbi:MAG: DsbE family thiol:disulfide interchange protein, partial [Pseudolabrys sp.]|nr:DsbE family thiol:disulfide interchange protein [Pseudolabrys sp.]